MGLTCDCGIDGDNDWWHFPPEDYTTLQTSKRKRCCSCGVLIDIGACCLRFQCERSSLTEIEDRIMGDVIELADKYHCETCGDLYFSLTELGFCIYLSDNMHHLVKEYASWARLKY